MKILVSLSLLFLLMGFGCCAPSFHNPKNNKQEAMVYMQGLQDGSEVFFVLSDQSLIEAQKQTPNDLYIKGVVEGGRFIPKSDILGVGDLAKEGRYGWLELTSKQFYPMESDKRAITPFVKGYMTDHGFLPSSREVYKEP